MPSMVDPDTAGVRSPEDLASAEAADRLTLGLLVLASGPEEGTAARIGLDAQENDCVAILAELARGDVERSV